MQKQKGRKGQAEGKGGALMVNTLYRIRQLKKEIRFLKKRIKADELASQALINYHKQETYRYKQMYTEIVEALDRLNKYNAFVKPYKKVPTDHLPIKLTQCSIPTFSPETLSPRLAVDYHVKLLDWLEAYGRYNKDPVGMRDAIMIDVEMSIPPGCIRKAISFTREGLYVAGGGRHIRRFLQDLANKLIAAILQEWEDNNPWKVKKNGR